MLTISTRWASRSNKMEKHQLRDAVRSPLILRTLHLWKTLRSSTLAENPMSWSIAVMERVTPTMRKMRRMNLRQAIGSSAASPARWTPTPGSPTTQLSLPDLPWSSAPEVKVDIGSMPSAWSSPKAFCFASLKTTASTSALITEACPSRRWLHHVRWCQWRESQWRWPIARLQFQWKWPQLRRAFCENFLTEMLFCCYIS